MPEARPQSLTTHSCSHPLYRGHHSPSSWSSAFIRVVWGSPQRASANLPWVGSSQVEASTQRWAGCLSEAPQLCSFRARPWWGRGSSAPLAEQDCRPLPLQQQRLPGHGGGLWVELHLACTQASASTPRGGGRESAVLPPFPVLTTAPCSPALCLCPCSQKIPAPWGEECSRWSRHSAHKHF